MTIIEKLCNYGVHYYEVKDKTNIKWLLGVSYRGIGLYEPNNRMISKKVNYNIKSKSYNVIIIIS